MNEIKYYVLVYYEPPHAAKYLISTKNEIISTGFNSINELYSKIESISKINKNEISLEIDSNLFQIIKKNLGYKNCSFILKVSDLEKLILKK